MNLPLFPLGTVLFPGMPLPLHIFEDRYKEMISECIDNNSPFGVVLIREGTAEHGSLATPHLVGTTAKISEVKRLPHGRMNIMAVGSERFRVNTLDSSSRSFLQADVEILPLHDTNSKAAYAGMRLLRPLVERYLTVLSEAGQVQFENDQLPGEPLALAYLGAVLTQEDDEFKQTLLESETTSALMKTLIRVYQREVALLDLMETLAQTEDDSQSPFSLN